MRTIALALLFSTAAVVAQEPAPPPAAPAVEITAEEMTRRLELPLGPQVLSKGKVSWLLIALRRVARESPGESAWINIVADPPLLEKMVEAKRRDVSVGEFLRDIAEQTGAELVTKGSVVEIREKGVPRPPWLIGSPGKLPEAMENLVIGSIAIGPESGVSGGVQELNKRIREEYPDMGKRMPSVTMDLSSDETRPIGTGLILKNVPAATVIRHLAQFTGHEVRVVAGEVVFQRPGGIAARPAEEIFEKEIRKFVRNEAALIRESRYRNERKRRLKEDPRDWERVLAKMLNEPGDRDLILTLIRVRDTWNDPRIREALGEAGAGEAPPARKADEPFPTTITKRFTKVTLPKRLILETDLPGEDMLRAVMTDEITGLQVNLRIGSGYGLRLRSSKDVRWDEVVFFQRGPGGLHDEQYYIFEREDGKVAEMFHGILGCHFTIDLPDHISHRTALDLLNSIKVEVADGWEIIHGPSPAHFEVRPVR